MYSLEFTEQALVRLDHDQVLVEVIVPGNQVKAITGGRTTKGDGHPQRKSWSIHGSIRKHVAKD